ncbi:hypothetical protein [Flavobacterium sp.]|uniref:hypothetical protein n=1 Tax=Flavobacterium sp. TaxID=239 RepID=UPI00286DFFCA|nr:hypothetical protein [Flavobacterium sp.]
MSCEREKGDYLTGNKNVGGLIGVNKQLVAYTIGNGTTFQYENVITADQSGIVKVLKVNVYKSYTDTQGTADPADDLVSNEALLKTIDLPSNSASVVVPFGVTYPELIQGLTIAGAPVAPVDTDLNIGDFFTLRYEQLRSDGVLVESAGTLSTKVAVGTRLAGSYKCINYAYYRLGVLSPVTFAQIPTINIESVDATTYKVVRQFGQFGPTATDQNNWFFTVIGNNITYPANDAGGAGQTGNDQPFATCATNAADFAILGNCATSNVVVLDNVAGKDKLFMNFGYITGTGAVGPRVFTWTLEKL